MTPIGHNKHTRHSMSTSLRTVVLAARWKGPSVRDEAPGHPWQHGASQVSHGVTCAPPNNSSSHYLLRTVGEEKPIQMWPCADQAFAPGCPSHPFPLAVYWEQWPLTQTVQPSIDHMWHLWHCMHPRYASPWCRRISQAFSGAGQPYRIPGLVTRASEWCVWFLLQINASL